MAGFIVVCGSSGVATAHLPEVVNVISGGGPLCSVACVAMETTAKVGSGPRKTVLHRNLPVMTPVAIDVDGGGQPQVVGSLDALGLFGYDLTVSITGGTGPVPSETDFTLRINKAAGAPLNLPVRAELVAGAVDDAAATKTTLGYDALNATAPRSFEVKVKRTTTTSTIQSWSQTSTTTLGNLSVTAPGSSLAVVTESFEGAAGPSGFDRPADRSQARLELGRNGVDGPLLGATVPATVGLRLFDRAGPEPAASVPDGATPPPGFQPTLTQMVLTHNAPVTALGFLTTSPSQAGGKVVTTGGIDRLPSRIDVALTEPDLDADGKGDTKVDYLATAGAPLAQVEIDETRSGGARSTHVARLTRVPAEAHVGLADTTLSDVSSRTRVEWTASSRTDLTVDSDVEDADTSAHTTASVMDVPRHIEELEYTSDEDAGKVVYHAVPVGTDDGRAGATRIFVRDRRAETEFEATTPRLPVAIERLDWSTPTDEINVGLDSSDPTPTATIRLLDDDLDDPDLPSGADSRSIVTTVDGVPADFELAIDTGDDRGATYEASGPVARVHVTGDSDASFAPEPGRAVVGDLDVLFEGIPRSVCASFPGTDKITARAGSGGVHDPDATVCDGEAEVGLVSVRLRTPTADAPADLPAGRDGLLVRDGVATTPGGPVPAAGEFVASARLAGLKSLVFEKKTTDVSSPIFDLTQDEVDLELEATGTDPRVVDVARTTTDTLWTQINDEDDPADDVEYDREGLETVVANIPDPPASTHADYVSISGETEEGRPFSSIDLGVTNDRAYDPASGEPALSLDRRVHYDFADPIPMAWRTGPGETFLPEEYPASDFEPTQEVTLDPLPQSFRICHADSTNDCTQDVFLPEHFRQESTSLHPSTHEVVHSERSFDFGPEDSNGGSFQMKASSPVTFDYHDLSFGPQRLKILIAAIPEEDPAPRDCEVIDPELGEWHCFEIKPGKNITTLDHLTGSSLSFQAHSEGSGGVIARFVPPLLNMLTFGLIGGGGHDTKGYLAMDTGWVADCFDGNRDPIECPFGENDFSLNDHKHLPAPPAFRMSGKLALGIDWRMPADDTGIWNPQPWTDAFPSGLITDLAGFDLGPLFSADHRIFEADPSDVEGSIIGVADVKNQSGHIYCDDPTTFLGDAADIEEHLCTAGAEGGTLPP